MSEMIKRASRAIAETIIEDTRPLEVKSAAYEMQARAAIKAMRDPTEEMVQALAWAKPCRFVDIAQTKADWRTMIDEALK